MSLLLASSTGCQTWLKTPKLTSPTEWFKAKTAEEKHGAPQRVAVIWTDDVLSQIGQPATRGFGGRLYFYNAEEKPVPVEGQLVIYGYDDSQSAQGAQRTPDRKFVFTPEQFKQHFSESQIGPSYSIWIPWEGLEGPRRDISLVPVFTTTGGTIVVGAQTVNVLTARSSDGRSQFNQVTETRRTRVPQIQPTSHLAPTQAGPAAASGDQEAGLATRSGLKSTTIPVTGAMSERLRNAPPMPAVGWPTPNAAPAQGTNLQSELPGQDSTRAGLVPPNQAANGTASAAALLDRYRSSLPPETALAPSLRGYSTEEAPLPQAPPPGARSALPRSPAPAWRGVPPDPAAPPTPPSPAESPFLRPSRL